MEVRILSLSGQTEVKRWSTLAGFSKTFCASTAATAQTHDSQQPVDGDQQTDVLGWQADGRQDQQHGHQSGAGNTGSSNTGQGGSHTKEGKEQISPEGTSG